MIIMSNINNAIDHIDGAIICLDRTNTIQAGIINSLETAKIILEKMVENENN